MDYSSTLDFLYNRLQSFHNQGATAYKPGLERTIRLSEMFGNPHKHLKVVHIGGTNGKGSTAHSVASVLQRAGLRIGLYTSPHLLDFRERIRINGEPISENEVIDFVDKFLREREPELEPSFFELTTIMAFEHFVRHKVDIAVIEVGLGGRLDSTNIVHPLVTAVTNISLDHTALLGNTLSAIAAEKAGIFKPGIPAVVGRMNNETDEVFRHVATELGSPLTFGEENPLFSYFKKEKDEIVYYGTPWGNIKSELTGDCQPENMTVILNVLHSLEKQRFVNLNQEILVDGLTHICSSTGLAGRWMKVSDRPLIYTDTAHNPDGWKLIAKQLKDHLPSLISIVIGFVNDKDISGILCQLPKEGRYYFVSPSVDRKADNKKVESTASTFGLTGRCYDSVAEGVKAAIEDAKSRNDTLIFVGGSTFVVSDFLSAINNKSVPL